MAAGVVAGVVAWLLGEATLGLIPPTRHQVNARGMMLAVADRWGETTAAIWNAGLAFACLGAALGAGAGLVGGLTAGSARRALVAASLGGLAGALGQVALSAAVLTPYGSYRYGHPDEASRDLLFPILVHATIWAAAGVIAGLAFALGSRQRALAGRAALAGGVGAALGAASFLVVEALVFPAGDTTSFVSTTAGARLAARLAVCILAVAGLATTLSDRRDRITTAPAAPTG